MITKFDFNFKGERKYIQGPDIVNKVIKYFDNPKNIDIRFSSLSSSNLAMFEGVNPSAKANISLALNEKIRNFHLEENGEVIQERQPYDEGLIVSKTKLEVSEQKIKLLEKTPYSFCENVVSLNKFLHQNLYPNEKGKWLFTRLEVFSLPPDDSLFSLLLIKNSNFRLTKTDVFLKNGDRIGAVYFSLLRG